MITNKRFNEVYDNIIGKLYDQETLEDVLNTVTESFDIVDTVQATEGMSSAMYLELNQMIYNVKNEAIETFEEKMSYSIDN